MIRVSIRSLLLVSLLLGASTAGWAQAKTPPADPTFKLQGLDGKVVDLSAQHGNVVLVSFGATWCGPCISELRALDELLAEYRNQPVKFFWVSVERVEEIDNAGLKRYAKERKLTFPVLRDTGKMVYLQFAERQRLPMIVLLDKDGKVDTPVSFGMKSSPGDYKSDMRARLNKLLQIPSDERSGAQSDAGRTATRAGHPALSESERE